MKHSMLFKRICGAIMAGALLSIPVFSISSARAAGETVLSVGKSYTVEYDSAIDGAYPAKAYEPETKLTDGQRAERAVTGDAAFLPLYRGTSVSVTIDLEKVCAVSSVEVSSLQIKAGGLQCPRYIRVAVSEDGEAFGTVGTLDDPNSVTIASAQIVRQTVTLEKAYRARYVRVTFSSDVHTYVDEITVSGSSDASGAASAVADAPVADRGFGSEIDGIGNIVLMYTLGKYTEEELLPYLLYVDTDGNPTDTMFEAMLFLPSGTSNYDYTTEAGWEAYLTEMLGVDTNTNLAALDSLVGKHSAELGGGKYPVFLSVPFLEPSSKPIGGIAPDNQENRTQVLKNLVDRIIDGFNASGFTNLELKGLYWHEELIPYTISNYEEQLIIDFNKYVHGKNLKTIWIPYYCAPGFERAVELGFDCATLQSGYAFSRLPEVVAEIGEVTAKAVDDSAAQAKKYGLGMEFELDTGRSDYKDRYFKYVHTGYQTGCMDGHMMMLYQSVKGILSCANGSKGSDARQVYEMTYQYINDSFTSLAPVVEPNQVIVAQVGARSSGKLAVSDGDTVRGSLQTAEVNVPEGLPFVVEGDGFYVLNASSAQPGLYEVSFVVTDGYNLSEPAKIKVLLYDPGTPGIALELTEDLPLFKRLDTSLAGDTLPAGSSATAREVDNGWYYVSAEVDGKTVDGFADAAAIGLGGSESEGEGGTEGGMPGWAIALLSAGAVVLVAAAAVAIMMKKRKK